MRQLFKFLSVLLFIICIGASVASAEITIVANPSVPATTLSAQEIQDIFLGITVIWDNKSKITFATLTGETHKAFLAAYVSRSETQYKAYWKNMLFTGQGIIPKSFDTEKEMLNFVAQTPGAIGYIGETTAPENVKTIAVK